MDNQHPRQNDTFNLSLQGISIQPKISSRPSSARSNSELKQPITPSRGGYYKFK